MFEKSFVLVLFSVLLISISSCGGEGGGANCNDELAVSNAYSEGFAAVLAASLSLDSDANEANCEKLVDALELWINNLEDLEVCAQEFGRGGDFRDAINEAKTDITDLSCG